MPKAAKSEKQWTRDLKAFAASKKPALGRGGQPRGGKWLDEYKKTLECPAHRSAVALNAFFGGNRRVTCDCTYHPCCREPAPPQQQQQAEPVPPVDPPPPVVHSIGSKLPRPPSPLKLPDIRGKSGWVKQKGKLNLYYFGLLTGKCYHCGSADICSKDVCSSLKFVWDYGFPCYCHGVDVKCKKCSKSMKSIDARCVQSLPRRDRLKIPFIQTGASCGVDMKIINMMRMGSFALQIMQGAEAAIHRKYECLRSNYEDGAKAALRLNPNCDSYEAFEALPKGWIPKNGQIMLAFLVDFKIHKPYLIAEMQALKSHCALAMDHQEKVAHRVGQGHMNDDLKGTQTAAANGDFGLSLNCTVVPSTDEVWAHDMLDEICRGHGDKCPKYLFVDCNCCNGILKNPDQPEPPQEGPLRHWQTKLTKKLDGFHVCMRIHRQSNPGHPRHRLFAQHIARAIHARDPDTEQAIENAQANLARPLNNVEKKNDWRRCGRSVPGPGLDVAERLFEVLDHHRAIDANERENHGLADEDLIDVDRSHPAHPIVTNKTTTIVVNQAVHALNGCMECKDISHVMLREKQCRNTDVCLPVHHSPFGSSKCETFHSVQIRIFYQANNFSEACFDARSLWKGTNFNRTKLMNVLGQDDVPPLGVAPAEFRDTILSEEEEPMLFGFDHCRKVLADRNNEIYVDAPMEMDFDDFYIGNDGKDDKKVDVKSLVKMEEEMKKEEAAHVTDVDDDFNDCTKTWDKPGDNTDREAIEARLKKERQQLKEGLVRKNSVQTSVVATQTSPERITIQLEVSTASTQTSPSRTSVIATQTSPERRTATTPTTATPTTTTPTPTMPTPTAPTTATHATPTMSPKPKQKVFGKSPKGRFRPSPKKKSPTRKRSAGVTSTEQASPTGTSTSTSPTSTSTANTSTPINNLHAPAPKEPTENDLIAVIAKRRKSLAGTTKLRRDVQRRRNARNDTHCHRPDFNPHVKRVWLDLVAGANARNRDIDNSYVEQVLKECNKMEIAEREKGEKERLPLPPVGFQCAKMFLKQKHDERNEAVRAARTCDENIAMVEDLENTLKPTDKSTLPKPATVACVPIYTQKAAKVKDNEGIDQSKKVRKRARCKCTTCGKFLGDGPGEHKKFKCPQETEEKKRKREEDEERLERERKLCLSGLEPRIRLAQEHTRKHPNHSFRHKSGKHGETVCPVCGFLCERGESRVSPNWHCVKHRRMVHCPLADQPSAKEDVIRGLDRVNDDRNSRRRAKRSKK